MAQPFIRDFGSERKKKQAVRGRKTKGSPLSIAERLRARERLRGETTREKNGTRKQNGKTNGKEVPLETPTITPAPTPAPTPTPIPTRAPTTAPIQTRLESLRTIETLLKREAPGTAQLLQVQREIEQLLQKPQTVDVDETGTSAGLDVGEEEDIEEGEIPGNGGGGGVGGDTTEDATQNTGPTATSENKQDAFEDPIVKTWAEENPDFVSENINKAEEVAQNIKIDNPKSNKSTKDWFTQNTINPNKDQKKAFDERTQTYQDEVERSKRKIAEEATRTLLNGGFNDDLVGVLMIYLATPACLGAAMSFGWWNLGGATAAAHSENFLNMGLDTLRSFANSNTVRYLTTSIRSGMGDIMTELQNNPGQLGFEIAKLVVEINAASQIVGEAVKSTKESIARRAEKLKLEREEARTKAKEKNGATPAPTPAPTSSTGAPTPAPTARTANGLPPPITANGGPTTSLASTVQAPGASGQLEGAQGVPGISIPARMGVAGSNPEVTGAEVSTTKNPITYTTSDLLGQKDLVVHIRTTMSEVLSFFNGDEWADFSEILSDKSSLKHRRPEEEEKMHVDLAEKDVIEDPQSLVDGITNFINVNANIVKRSIESLDSLISNSISKSETELTRNHHRRKKERIDVERVKRANRKKLRELFSSSTGFSRGRKKALTTGEFSTIEHVPATLVGRMLLSVLMKQNIHAGNNAQSSFSTANDLNLFAESSAADQIKEQDLFMMNEIRFQWDVMHNALDEMSMNIKMAVHAGSTSGAGQLLTTKMVILLLESMSRAKSALSFSTNKPEDPERDGGNNEFQTSNNALQSEEGESGGFEDFQSSSNSGFLNNFTQAIMPDVQDNDTDRNAVNPLRTQEHLQIRPSFIGIGGKAVQKAREDEILNDILWNSFDYVSPNGYLGERNKIHRDNLRNQQIRAIAPLFFGQTWEPNHGLHPLTAELQTVKRPRDVQNWANKLKRRRNVKRRRVKMGEILHGDLNEMKSTKGLPYRKPSPFRFTTDNQFQLQPAFLPDGHTLSKQKLRDTTSETWNFPHQKSRVISISQTTKPLQEKMAQYLTHYSNVATY